MFKNSKLPLIFQSEMAECGLVCLAMILGYYHYPISLTHLRQKIKTTIHGVTLHQLKQIAESCGMVVNVLRLEMNQLSSVQLPCVMHWELNHFIVVRKLLPDRLIAHDPACGVRSISLSEVAQAFTGIILEVLPDKSMSPPLTMKAKSLFNLSAFIKQHSYSLLMLMLVTAVIQLSYIGGISCIQKLIDGASHHVNRHNFILVLLLLFGMKILEISATSIRSLMVITSGTLINHRFGFNIMEHLMHLRLTYFENRHVGEILSRFSAIEKMKSTLTEGIAEGIVDGLVSLLVLLMMLSVNLKLGLIIAFTGLIYFFLRIYHCRQAIQYQEEAVHLRAQEVSHFMETLHSMSAIKLFKKELTRLGDWNHKFISSLNAMTKMIWHKIFCESIKNAIFGIELIITLCLACVLLEGNKISLGALYAYLSYRLQFIHGISGLADKFQEYRSLMVNLVRLEDILHEPRESVGVCDKLSIPEQKTGTLRLENISFSYAKDIPLINNIHLTIQSGECVAITGPSGCGKTTLLKMMMGLLQPTEGKIYLGNYLINDGQHVSRPPDIAAVLQSDSLFAGTILENISFFSPSPDLAWVYRCAEWAGILQDINGMPMRFSTLIGNMGSTLSGGQKQRLLIARALYTKPRILFLDEATSHLDAIKEQEVNLALRSLGLTIIMVAHRKETIAMADRVIASHS